MTWKKIALQLGAYAAATYAVDVLARPSLMAYKARRLAGGKPILNVGAGTPGSSLRTLLFGPTTWGDVNIDIAASREIPCKRGAVCFGDAHQLPYPDKHFGAVIASHVLEHLKDPWQAMAEWSRVGDRVFVVTPPWWAVHTWAHPGHLWWIEAGRARPLWPGGVAVKNGGDISWPDDRGLFPTPTRALGADQSQALPLMHSRFMRRWL